MNSCSVSPSSLSHWPSALGLQGVEPQGGLHPETWQLNVGLPPFRGPGWYQVLLQSRLAACASQGACPTSIGQQRMPVQAARLGTSIVSCCPASATDLAAAGPAQVPPAWQAQGQPFACLNSMQSLSSQGSNRLLSTTRAQCSQSRLNGGQLWRPG